MLSVIEEKESGEDLTMCEKEKCTFCGHDGSYNTHPPHLFQLQFLKAYLFICVVDAQVAFFFVKLRFESISFEGG